MCVSTNGLRSGSVSICRMRILQRELRAWWAAIIAQPESRQVNPVVGYGRAD
jgi:hypothetical protein